MLTLTGISPVALVLATLFNMILGYFWYHPRFLGGPWIDAHGFREDALKGNVKSYIGALVVGLIMAWVVGVFVHSLQASTISQALELAFFMWLGFIATAHFSGVIWAKKPIEVYLIDASFYLVSLAGMTLIFTLLR